MDITTYITELSQEGHNMLVKENSYAYAKDCLKNPVGSGRNAEYRFSA